MSRFSGVDAAEQPRALALVMCDRVIVDEGSKKRSLIDLFDTIYVAKLPAGILRMYIYFMVARGTQETDEIFLGLFAPSGEAIVKCGVKIETWGDRGQAEFTLPLDRLKLPEVGVYDLRLFVADYVLAQRPLVVQMLPQPPVEPADSPTP